MESYVTSMEKANQKLNGIEFVLRQKNKGVLDSNQIINLAYTEFEEKGNRIAYQAVETYVNYPELYYVADVFRESCNSELNIHLQSLKGKH